MPNIVVLQPSWTKPKSITAPSLPGSNSRTPSSCSSENWPNQSRLIVRRMMTITTSAVTISSSVPIMASPSWVGNTSLCRSHIRCSQSRIFSCCRWIPQVHQDPYPCAAVSHSRTQTIPPAGMYQPRYSSPPRAWAVTRVKCVHIWVSGTLIMR